MHKVNKIQIRGFRRLRDIAIEMRPLMVLIGANDVGKSSLLDAVSLLSASAAGTMNKALSILGGIADVCTRGQPERIALEAEMDCPGYRPLYYRLELEAKGQGYGIPLEVLSQEREGDYSGPFKHIESHDNDVRYYNIEDRAPVRPDWDHNPLETSILSLCGGALVP